MRTIYKKAISVYVRLRTQWLIRKKNGMKAVTPPVIVASEPASLPASAQRKEKKIRSSKETTGRSASDPSQVQALMKQLETYLEAEYEFRFNVINDANEYRRKGCTEPFRVLGKREENSICIKAYQQGIPCWDRDVRRYVHSLQIPSYHPLREYMGHLPQWDGEDRVYPLVRRVSADPLWVDGFRRWMLALTAQWMGMNGLHANSVAPVLVSRRQGRHKSTFCKLLLPEMLQPYYTDHYDLNADSCAVQKLAAFGLINLDELDKFSDKKMALLKNVMQMADVNIRKAYQKGYSTLPRIASFIATSNQTNLLTDPTGSRRFLCVEVEDKIDTSPVDHAQLYAQLKTELLAGERYWFTADEEAAIIRHNAAFQKTGMEHDVFSLHFRSPASGEAGQWLSAAHIFEHLKKHHPAAMRSSSPQAFGKVLTALGLERRHGKQTNQYRVVQVEYKATA